MLFSVIVDTSANVAQTRSRKAKTGYLAACLRQLPRAELGIGTAYLAGHLPQGRIGIGPSTVSRSLPDTAAPTPQLSLAHVHQALDRIAQTTGSGSAARRMHLLKQLLAQATRVEQEFLVKLLMGELRQGALEGLMAEAIAEAAGVPAPAVRRAWMLADDPGAVATAALDHGVAGLSRFRLTVLRPVQPMLAQSANDVADALALLADEAALEYKLDGARVQVHKSGDTVRVFTRRLNEVTAAVPEVVDAVRNLRANSLILDGEVLALRPDGMPHPFQNTMRRFGRKADVEALRRDLPLKALFFDCLHLDGQDLIDLPARARFEALGDAVDDGQLVPRLVTREVDKAQSFMGESLRQGHEGVMAKALDTPYQAGSRGSDWLKVKRSHTLDLVVLAAEWGSGRRSGWLSNLHLGARDTSSGGFVMLGKTFKGMTDKMLAWQTEHLQTLMTTQDGITAAVRPELVVEIAFNDIQASPRYPGGLALRFARVKRYRPDKSPTEADTMDTIRAIYAQQFAAGDAEA
ncbi:MAG: ATP-dependent DNA ligase [Gammaproteobacteria bacterium]|nr:ATP-dependent DNA ligase [Gammaproteobacteria bacterium]